MNSLSYVLGIKRDAAPDMEKAGASEEDYCEKLAKTVASGRRGSLKSAKELIKKYEEKIKAGELQVCNVSKYGLVGAGSIVEKQTDIVVYGNVEYIEDNWEEEEA